MTDDIIVEISDAIPSLTEVEAMELDVRAAQRIIAHNSRILSALNAKIAEASHSLGKAKIEVQKKKTELDKLKNTKSILVEINKSMKTICQNG